MSPETIVVGVFALVLAVRFGGLVLRLKEVREDAHAVWEQRRTEFADLGEEKFKRIFRKVHGARGGLLGFAALGVAGAVTPFALAAVNAAWMWGWNEYGRDPLYASGTLIWMFFLFFAMIAVWALVAWVFAVIYHRGRPRSLDAELKLARFDAS